MKSELSVFINEQLSSAPPPLPVGFPPQSNDSPKSKSFDIPKQLDPNNNPFSPHKPTSLVITNF